jgi:MerR family copper efflux transcriptional regulator
MKIGEVAHRTGLSTKAIRYYEDIGILPEAQRRPNGYRAYESSTLDRIEFIKDAQAAGLSLTEIQTILELREAGESTCHHTIALLESHLADVDRQLVELGRTRSRLQRMIKDARALDPADCTDPNSCQTIARP